MRLESWPYKVKLLLRSLLRRRDVERELDEELAYHLERQTEQNVARGMTEQAARREARKAISNVEARKEECRDNWAVAAFDHIARDTGLALRSFRRDAPFAAGVLALLALGIGANVAVFSLVDAVLFRPLPYKEPERLAVVRESIPERDDEGTRSVNALHYLRWRDCGCFEDIALSEFVQAVNLTGAGEPVRVPALRLTPNAFSLLGVSAQLGRTFEAGDAAAENVVVISDGLWQRQFSGDPEILGRSIEMDGVETVIIGVLPRGFHYYAAEAPIDVYRPWRLQPIPPWWGWNGNYSYTALAKLADGLPAEAALAELNALQAAIATDHFGTVGASLSLRAALVPLHEWVTGRSRTGLLLLLAAVGVTFIVACLNIANLMLARATSRGRETGIRSALGASRMAIFRGVLIESVLLAYTVSGRTREIAMRLALGAGRGDVVAMVLRQGMRPVVAGLAMGMLAGVVLGRFVSSLLYAVTPTDAATLASVFLVTLVAALCAAWLPARRAARTSVAGALRD